jgi:hypothetical protein
VISAVTKTGSNVWRGGVGYYFRADNQPDRRELRQLPTDASQAEYITRPEDDYSRHEPTFDLGGPIVKNRAWFYVGTAPELVRTARTVTFRTGGTTQTFKQNENDYNTIGTVTAQVNSTMRLKGTVNIQSLKDLPGPTGSAGAFPTIEPDGTSTSNPTLFPSPIYLDTFDNFYVGALDWVMTPKLFANITVGTYDYGTHGGGAGEALRHTVRHVEHSKLELQLSGDSGFTAIRQRLCRPAVEQRDQVRRLQASRGERRPVVLRQQVGPALHQDRLPVRAHRQLAPRRRAVPVDQPAVGLAAQHPRRPQRPRHLRPLHGDEGLQLR